MREQVLFYPFLVDFGNKIILYFVKEKKEKIVTDKG